MDANSTTSSGTRSSKKLKGKKWEPLQLPPDDVLESTSAEQLHEMRLPSGYTLRFFPHDMRHMYTAPSKRIHLTRGVVDYIREHNQLGPNKTKTKLFLCSVFERSSACENGFMCREVHCDLKVAQSRVRSLAPPLSGGNRSTADVDESTNPLFVLEKHSPDASGPTSTDNNEFGNSIASSTDGESSSSASSHVLKSALMLVVDPNEDELVSTAVHMRSAAEDAHPRLPSGVTYRLALPNMQSPIDEVPSEKVFVTKGAKDYYDQVVAGEVPTMNMQHCAHFSKNGMCCFGSDCQFVHVAQYHRRGSAIDSESSGADSGSERDSRRSKGSRSSSTSSSKPKYRRGVTSSENPLSLDDHMKSVVVGVQPSSGLLAQQPLHGGGGHVMLASQNMANLQFQQQQPFVQQSIGGLYTGSSGGMSTGQPYGPTTVFATVGGGGGGMQQQQGAPLQTMPSSLASPPSYVPLPQQQQQQQQPQQRIVFQQQPPQATSLSSGGQPSTFYSTPNMLQHQGGPQINMVGTGNGQASNVGPTSPQQAPMWVSSPPSPPQQHAQQQQQPMYFMIPQQQGGQQIQGAMMQQPTHQQPYFVVNNAQQQQQPMFQQQPQHQQQPQQLQPSIPNHSGVQQPPQQFVQFPGGPFFQNMPQQQQQPTSNSMSFQPSSGNHTNSPQQQQRMVVIGGSRPPPGYQPMPQQQQPGQAPHQQNQQQQPQQHFFY